jgi:hypothetical protein
VRVAVGSLEADSESTDRSGRLADREFGPIPKAALFTLVGLPSASWYVASPTFPIPLTEPDRDLPSETLTAARSTPRNSPISGENASLPRAVKDRLTAFYRSADALDGHCAVSIPFLGSSAAHRAKRQREKAIFQR